MEAFGERYGFVWQAHKKGDANRSAPRRARLRPLRAQLSGRPLLLLELIAR
jgi:hypothetical protein